MNNMVCVIGRLIRNVKVEKEENKSVVRMTLAVPRSYKNEDGVYDVDFVDIVMWNGIAENTEEYCKKGDLVGVKGRIETRIVEKDNMITKITEIVAEKVTLLSSKPKDENNGE